MSGLAGSSSEAIKNHAAFIWSVADVLRGDCRQSEYGKVVLSLAVLRRVDCVLAPVKADMLARYEQLQGGVENFGPIRGKSSSPLLPYGGWFHSHRLEVARLCSDVPRRLLPPARGS